MQRYIEQLIDDIHKATWKINPPHEIWNDVDTDNEAELEDLAYAEKYIYGEPLPISEITEIDPKLLPPKEKLTQEQQALLSTELEKLLQHFHFYLNFPDDYPAHLRYPFILKFWEEEHVPLSFGEDHVELCDFNEENCPFVGYCTVCEEFNEEVKNGHAEDGESWDTDDYILPF